MQSRADPRGALIVVNGSIVVSSPISTSTSITVAAGSTIVHARAHVPLVDRRLRELAHLGQRDAVVDAEHQPGSVDHVRRDRLPVGPAAASSTCGRYSSPCAFSALKAGQRRPQRSRVEHVDARVDLADLELGLRGVAVLLGLHHALDRSARVAHHPPVAARVLEHRRGHRRRGAASRVRLGQLPDRLGAHQRHVAAQHHHRARPRRAGSPRGTRAGPSPQRPPRRCRWSAAAPPAPRPPAAPPSSARAGESTTTTLLGPGLQGRLHRPQHHRAAAQLVQHLRRLRAHARALARGEDQDSGSGHAGNAIR